MKKKLSIIPIPDARLIPKYLLEQVKDRKWTPEEWYEHQIKLHGIESNLVLSIIDKKHQVKGLIWLTIDGFEKHIHINTLSVDKEYQKKSKLINFVAKYIRELGKALKIETVLWTTRRPKALERYGFKESDFKIMYGEV